MHKQKAKPNSESFPSPPTSKARACTLSARERRIICAAQSGRGQWRLYLMSLAVLLVVPIEGWDIARKLMSPQRYGFVDYGIPLMIISIHIILLLKVKQRRDYLALIRKLSA